ncbi:BA14K family protein [Bradyrhizobium sp. CER78]|uniref:BA14K family protein n=1 Tax=Bradyrhizobium sp. CER78 TaxID=3039162 RepID=UPI00244B0DE4|nr:BA14K family protein [Bradyrhizobium sp. CER78]MDH2381097.1 BA14K family protein [Bradyrhizobium sp. CER78]
MMKLGTLVVAAITAGAMTLSTVVPSFAAPLAPAARLQDQPTSVEHVQYRHWHGGPRYGHRGGYGYRGGYHHHHHGGGNGAAVIGGLAAGAIIGGAIAASQAKANNDAYCSQRFRSYDPASGTYIASGGVRRSCP